MTTEKKESGAANAAPEAKEPSASKGTAKRRGRKPRTEAFPPDRPRVVLSRNIDDDVTALAAALATSGAEYYRRGSTIVFAETVLEERTDKLNPGSGTVIKLPVGAVTLQRVSVDLLRGDLSHYIDIRRCNAKGVDVPVEAPADRARTLLEYGARLSAIPLVRGIARVPLIDLRTGALRTQEGYDEESRMLVRMGDGVDFEKLEVPARPSKAEALQSIERLLWLIKDSPLTPESRSVVLSAFLTAVLRPVMTFAPMHCTSAPTKGSGKTILIQAASIFSTGTVAPVITLSGENAEAEIEAAILGAYPVAMLDNVTKQLGSDRLCAALTAEQSAVKLMYNQKHIAVPNQTFWCATGNNLQLRGDLHRRSLCARIITEEEHPEWRPEEKFSILGGADGFVTHCREHRTEYVRDLFTVARWGIQIGKAAVAAKIEALSKADEYLASGSFEQWNRHVRLPLVMLGQPDPLQEQRTQADADPDRVEHYEVLEAIAKHIGTRKWLVKDLAAIEAPEFKALRARPNGIGTWLREHLNKHVGNLVLRRQDKLLHGAVLWYVERIYEKFPADMPWQEQMRRFKAASGLEDDTSDGKAN